MANQDENEQVGLGKKIGVFIVFMALAVGYYFMIDKVLMGPVQNLPFPYK